MPEAQLILASKLAGRKIGRPGIYRPEYDDLIERCRLLMKTPGEIAEFFGVSSGTIEGWRRKHPSFASAYARGGDDLDLEVTVSLAQRAKGYSHKAEKIMVTKDGDVIREEYTQHYPPDTAAASLWLGNRQRGRWSMKPEADTADAATSVVIKGGLPDDE